MLLAGSLFLLAHLSPPLDGEDAMAISRRFLDRMHVKGPFEIAQLSQYHDDKPPDYPKGCWLLSFKRPGKAPVGLIVSPAGKVSSYNRGNLPKAPPTQDPQSEQIKRQAWGFVNQVREGREMDLAGIAGGPLGILATFTYRVNHRPLFNLNPNYGYVLAFDPDSHELTWFGGSLPAPSASPTIAKINQARALYKLKEYVAKNYNTDGVARPLAPDWPSHNYAVAAELGYFKFKRESSARLVWRGVVTMKTPGKTYPQGTLSTMVDASTGELIAPDDQGIR